MALNKLDTKAVSKNLLNLIKKLMADHHFDCFYLVGGTSLALRLGHRKSEDIDLFTHEDFDTEEKSDNLYECYSASSLEKERNTVRAFVDNIKIDFISHKYQLLEPIEHISAIRMAGLKDIAAMKINAISNRGSKKDFWDYAGLLDHFTSEEMLTFFQTKYPGANAWHAEKSLSFFDDAEDDLDPIDLSGQTWSAIKQKISQSLGI